MSKQTVKLAIQQLWHYALYFRQQPRLPSQRFAIFGRGRSGSTVLTSLLNAHRHISCEGEILHDRVFFPRLHIDWCASRCQSEVYGFKLLSYQLRDVQPIGNPARFLRSLYDGGYQFIYLTRRNLLFHALSNLNARQNKFHHRLQEGTLASAPLQVSVNEVLRWLKHSEELGCFERHLLQNIPHFSLTYEDDLLYASSHQTTVDRLCALLNLPSEPVKTNLVKLMPPRLPDMVENYEELVKALQSTPYAVFLEAEQQR